MTKLETKSYSEYRDQLKRVDLSNGVNEKEAIIIAQNYVIDMIIEGEEFFKKLGIKEAKVSNDPSYVNKFPGEWVVIFPMRWGFLKTWNVLYVDKSSGEVTSGGPIK